MKTRGGWSEWQLGALLAEMLTPGSVRKNMKTRDETDERVEFAQSNCRETKTERRCGCRSTRNSRWNTTSVWRSAQEKGDAEAVETAVRTLETQLKKCAKDICDKYINPPKTTDFALLFLPSEGLYAEAIRRVGLVQNVQRDCRVTFVGPTTLAALLQQSANGIPHAGDSEALQRSVESCSPA